MFTSGSPFFSMIVFLRENQIPKACQESSRIYTTGRRRKLPASSHSKTFSAIVAGAWPSTKKLATRSPNNCTQIHFRTAWESSQPRRAVREPQTHAKTCQTPQKTPNTREIVVAAAHAEGKTAAIKLTPTAPKAANNPMAASK